MKLLILSRGPNLYSTRRLAEAARLQGHDCEIVDPLKCYMNITANDHQVHYNGRKLTDIDAVIPRIGASITFYGTAVLRQFEMMGVYSLNRARAIVRARDKLRSLQMLAARGIGLPVTGFAHSPEATDDLIRMAGGAPLIIKLLEGTQGIGVVLAETRQAAASVIDAFRVLKEYFLVQEYVKEAEGSDLRCFVIGGKVVAAMHRQGKEGEFRSNLHRGGRARTVQITEEERETAVKATRVMGLNLAGVDILRSKRGPLVMEVNASPGLEGIEQATGLDVAGAIIEFVESHHRKRNARVKTRKAAG